MRLFNLAFYTHKYFVVLCISLVIGNLETVYAQISVVKGVIVDAKTVQPIPYVSIGVKNKTVGTVSDSTGRYILSYSAAEPTETDSIFFSAIGYERLKMSWKAFLNAGATIKLEESIQLLQTVAIKAKPGRLKNYGRSTANLIFFPSMYKKIPKQSDEKGREQASILKINQNVILRKLSFMINRRGFSKIKLRMNIYTLKEGMPDQSLLNKDVVFEVAGSTAIGIPRAEVVDLLPYQIQLKGHKEIAVSLAIIDLKPLEGDTSKPAFFIPSFPAPLRSSLFRVKSEAQWQKVSSSYLMIGLEASSLKVDGSAGIGDDDAKEESESYEAALIKKDTTLSAMLYGNNKGKRIKVDGAEIYYETYGQGKPLILLHGNNESINSFRKQIAPLAEHFQVIAIDTRGQGNSSNTKTSAYTYGQFAQDLTAVMDALAIKKASLLGWSDGGNTALTLALQHPERIEKIVLMGANLYPGKGAIKQDVIEIFEKRRDSLLQLNDLVSQNQLRLTELVLLEPHLKPESLNTIMNPILVLAGEHDVIKEEHTRLIYSHLKNSRLEIIPGADHYAPLKAPEVFNRIVLDFLKSGTSLW